MAFLGTLEEQPSLAQKLGRGIGTGISNGVTGGLNFVQKMALQNQQGKALANQAKQLEKAKATELGLGTIERMRGLISSAGPSNWVEGILGGQKTKDRAELESLGRSLIPLVSAGVPIRNQKEFEEYRKVITNPNARQAELQGALDGIQNILERSSESSTQSSKEKSSEKSRMKFSNQNPEHRKKAEQLFKTYKNKEKVREALAREFDFE